MSSLNIKIDFRSRIPIYVQIMNQVKHMIATGLLNPDDQLPTVRQMAADLRVNFNTVARAYRMLDEDGLISTQHGRGTFILPPESEAQSAQLLDENIRQLTIQYLKDAEALGLSPENVREILLDNVEQWEQTGVLPETGKKSHQKNRRQK